MGTRSFLNSRNDFGFSFNFFILSCHAFFDSYHVIVLPACLGVRTRGSGSRFSFRVVSVVDFGSSVRPVATSVSDVSVIVIAVKVKVSTIVGSAVFGYVSAVGRSSAGMVFLARKVDIVSLRVFTRRS